MLEIHEKEGTPVMGLTHDVDSGLRLHLCLIQERSQKHFVPRLLFSESAGAPFSPLLDVFLHQNASVTSSVCLLEDMKTGVSNEDLMLHLIASVLYSLFIQCLWKIQVNLASLVRIRASLISMD